MTVFEIFTTIGISSLVLGLLYIGRKLQILDDLQAGVVKVKTNLKVVSDFLTRTSTEFDHTELQAYSPLTLTTEGKSLIKDLGFDTVFEEHKDDFFTCIDEEEPKLKYDVEQAAISAVSFLADQDYMSPLKVFFYNNPARNIQNTGPTLGVYVRDQYLVEHPEITE